MLSACILAGFIGGKDLNYLYLIASCLISLVGYFLYRFDHLRILSDSSGKNAFLQSLPNAIVMQSIPPLIIFAIFKIIF